MADSVKRIYNIDFLRIFFVILIVYYHFIGAPYAIKYGEPFTSLAYNSRWIGPIGNAALFIVSGYFLFHSINNTDKFFSFLKSKFYRIWPNLAFLIGCLSFLDILGIIKIDIGLAFLNLCFITQQGTALATKSLYYNATWFVCTLFWVQIFYFCIFRIVFKNNPLFIPFFIFILSWMMLSIYINHPVRDNTVLYGVLSKSGAGAIACVGIGILIAILFEKTQIKNLRLNFYIASLLEIGLIFYFIHGLLLVKFTTQYLLILLLFSILFILFIIRGG